MSNDRTLQQRIIDANQLAADFEQQAQRFARVGGGYNISHSFLVDYIKNYRDLFHDDSERGAAPPLRLHRIHIETDLELPDGRYPAIDFRKCNFGANVGLKNCHIAGNLSLRNIESKHQKQFLFKDVYLAGDVYIEQSGLENVFDHCEMRGMYAWQGTSHAITLRNKSKLLSDCHLGAWSEVEIEQTHVFGDLEISNAQDCAVLHIDDCHVGRGTVIANVKVHTDLRITASQFEKGFTFSCQLEREGIFENNQFHREASFHRSQFHGRTSFKGSTFHCAPAFFNSMLFPDTDFQQAKFLAFDGEREYAAYRELRHIAHNTLKSAQDESRFFAFEQRALANVQIKQKGKRLEGWLSKLYGIASDYGQSILRPLFGLFGVNALFAGIYSFIPGAVTIAKEVHDAQAWQTRTPDYIGLTLQNIFQPFAIMGKTASYIPNCGLVVFLSGFQTLATLTLFALIILAIRRRFRKGSE